MYHDDLSKPFKLSLPLGHMLYVRVTLKAMT